MKNHLNIIIVFAICLLCSCQNLGREVADTDNQPSIIEYSIRQIDTDFPEVSSPTIQLEDRNKFSYYLVRREQTVLSRQDHSECSSMYYEMPVVLVFDDKLQNYTIDNDVSAEIAAINATFEQKCHDFFEDATDFIILSQELATRHTDESSKFGEYCNELETQVTQCDKSIFSVRQILHWCTYGVETWSESGLTFSLETGEMLGIDDFINMDYSTFNKTILDFLFDHISDDWRIDMKRELYGDIFNDFSDHTFYYKDGSLYIIFPALSNENDWIVRWSISDSIPIECLCGVSTSEENT